MDIKEIRKEKDLLESDIANLLNVFYKKTDVCIRKIRSARITDRTRNGEIINKFVVSVELENLY
jgi:hypothetical protein